MEFIDATSPVAKQGQRRIALRCPKCRREGTLDAIGQNDLHFSGQLRGVAHRRCPNPACRTYILVIFDPNGSVVATYPPEVIDFDATNIPSPVVEALEEAITCHAHECYAAAAVMVRKTLEELCADREATGADLKERIKALGEKVVLPRELFEGLDDLRLLGNDAAHIESKVYNTIGLAEVEVGIEFTKEVLKAVYQMSELLARLRGLRAE